MSAESKIPILRDSIGYLRKRPIYDDPESFTYSMRELRQIGSNCMENTVADFLVLLEMQSCHEIAKRLDAERTAQARQTEVEEERLRKDD